MRIIAKDFIIEDITPEEAKVLLGLASAKKTRGKGRKGPQDEFELPKGAEKPLDSKLREKGGTPVPYEDYEILYIYKRLQEKPRPKLKDVYEEGIDSGSLRPERALSAVHNIRAYLKHGQREKMSETTWKIIQDIKQKEKEKTDSFIGSIIK